MNKNFLNLKKFKDTVNHGFFTLKGGVSVGNYFSLNCNQGNNDKTKNAKQNIKIALKKLKINNKKIKLIDQIHSKRIVFINKKNHNKKYQGDGLITKEKNLALGVLTADCAPVFIFDKNKSVICVLHIGWKGGLKNIAREAIKKLKAKKIKIFNIIAIVGPCLGYKNFEVDKDFKQKFVQKNKLYSQFFKSKNKNKDLFNLRGLINFQFKEMSLNNVYNITKDTYKNRHMFFSHRRAIHHKKDETGRMINIISFKD